MVGLVDFQYNYSESPIILVAGVAGQGQIPISVYLNQTAFRGGITSIQSPAGNNPAQAGSSHNNFGVFSVLPGGTLIDNQIAHYPLANQAVAANAVVTQPLKISLEMTAPALDVVPFSLKQSVFRALKSALDQHISLGGYFTVQTPAYVYENCLLENLVDGSDADFEGAQPQIRWIWSFEQPLLTVQQGQAAQSQAAARITNNQYNVGDPPGSVPLITNQSSSPVANAVVPSTSSLVGSSVSPATRTPSAPANLSSVSPVVPGGFS